MFDAPASAPVEWKVHLVSAPDLVFERLTTDRGRESFWVERSTSSDGTFTLTFSGGEELTCEVVAQSRPHHFSFRYFGGTLVEFHLDEDGAGGTDLSLSEIGFKDRPHRTENLAGWIQVLLCLKAAADHQLDLRNHDPKRTWSAGYCDT